jgi:hypothetical protein
MSFDLHLALVNIWRDLHAIARYAKAAGLYSISSCISLLFQSKYMCFAGHLACLHTVRLAAHHLFTSPDAQSKRLSWLLLRKNQVRRNLNCSTPFSCCLSKKQKITRVLNFVILLFVLFVNSHPARTWNEQVFEKSWLVLISQGRCGRWRMIMRLPRLHL